MTTIQAPNSGFEAKVVCRSSFKGSPDLITMQLRYPRFFHSEFMTHRVFSRSASSSRAIPVKKMIEQVRNKPAMPLYWGSNKPGMQAGAELTGEDLANAKSMWRFAANEAANVAEEMNSLGLHKQVANRILEPFQFIHVIVTSTEWQNFFDLRISEFAMPEMRHLAELMWEAIYGATVSRNLKAGEYHLPYITEEERCGGRWTDQALCRISSARCARVSYLNHDGSDPDPVKDMDLAKDLFDRIHASPFEHVATPLTKDYSVDMCRNFKGWVQYRAIVGL